MRWVDKPFYSPKTCCVIPGRGEASGDRFVDTGNDLVGMDPHAYVSEAGARNLARFIGWTSPEDAQKLQERVDDLELKLAEAEAENDQLGAWIDAIDALESADLRARKKPGRPKKEKS